MITGVNHSVVKKLLIRRSRSRKYLRRLGLGKSITKAVTKSRLVNRRLKILRISLNREIRLTLAHYGFGSRMIYTTKNLSLIEMYAQSLL
ncbi:MAG: hypothetical protein KME29_05170 [Calothrix sp. FI2-JRJ7]|jgi:hypothetical protein|nr:hypothetical protein [Calothrix sp. FI2-JRJ7]